MASGTRANPSLGREGLFASSASRLSAISALVFGWRPSEFWGATPAELHAIIAEMKGTAAENLPPDRTDMTNLMEMFPDG